MKTMKKIATFYIVVMAALNAIAQNINHVYPFAMRLVRIALA